MPRLCQLIFDNNFFRIVPKKRVVKVHKKSAIIYSNPSPIKKNIFYFGNIIFTISLIFAVYLYFPLLSSIYKFYLSNSVNYRQSSQVSFQNLVQDNINKNSINDTFYLYIPKILAESKVIKYLSPYDDQIAKEILADGLIGHAAGTDLPGSGQGKMVYLFAHSTEQNIFGIRNNSVFFLLGELNGGDDIYIDYQGTKYTYRVFDKTIVEPSRIDFLEYREPNDEVLILQTCWPPGTTWKRLLVFARKVQSL